MIRYISTVPLAAAFAVIFAGCSSGGGTLPPGNSRLAPAAATSVHGSRALGTTRAASVAAFSDNFSQDPLGGAAAGWSVVSGTWSICNNGTVQGYCQTSHATGESLSGSTAWTDYTVDALVSDRNNGTYGGVAVIGRAASPSRFYQLEIRPQVNGSTPYWYLDKTRDGVWTTLASGPLSAPDTNPNYHLNMAFSGSTITASIAFDGGTTYRQLATVTDTTYPSGQIGMHTYATAVGLLQSITVNTASATTLPTDTAVAASTFVNSIGMNAHFESPIYYNNTGTVASLVGNLGVRHYRVSASNILFANQGYLATITSLHNTYGINFDVLSDLNTTPAQVISAVSLLPANSVDSIEGPNETDNPGQGPGYDANFAVDVPAYMQSLYSLVKSTPATAMIPVIGPSFVNSSSYGAVGNISASLDEGNMHDYFAAFNPGTPGWGGSGYSFAPSLNYGSIAWNIASAAQASGSKPVVASETGYFTANIHGGVPFDVQAKYVPRLYLEQYRQNVPRTFMYQLIGYDTTSGDGSLDIVSPSYAPSPAYGALAAMLGILADPGGTTATMPYNWSLSGQTTNVDHLLLHKSNGAVYLPLWIEAQSFDPNANGGAGAEITVPSQSVTVSVAQNPTSATLWTNTPANGTWSSQPVAFVNGSATITVTDTVSILAIGAP